MKNLPDIGTNALVVMDSEKRVVTIIAHYQDKAVYVYKTHNNFSRVDMATAFGFEEIPLIKEPTVQMSCSAGQHNYVQVHEAHQNKAFCTRCGNTITLE